MKKLLFISIALLSFYCSSAQNVVINTDGAPGDNSAILDIQSTNSGLLIPRMTSVEKNAIISPAQGLIVFDTTIDTFSYFDGTWKTLDDGVIPQTLTLNGQQLSISDGNTITLPGSTDEHRIQDSDGDTRIETEDTPDEDIVRIYIGENPLPLYSFTEKGIGFDGGNESVAIGANAGVNNSSGTNNTYIGQRAGNANETGNYNTYIGFEAGQDNTGTSNTVVGTQSGINLIGNNNTMLGDYIAPGMNSGDNNVFLGAGSGASLNQGSGNVIIGTNAGGTGSYDNRLYIHNSGSTTPLLYGEFDNQLLVINGLVDAANGLVVGSSATEQDGMIRFSNGTFEGYDGTDWLNLSESNSGGVFSTIAGVATYTGDNAQDDFVFGSNTLDANSTPFSWNRFFFDNSQGSFRAGACLTDNWNESNIGLYSFATNSDTKASGNGSFAANQSTEALATNSTAFGFFTDANSFSSVAFGAHNLGLSANSGMHNNANTVLEVGIGTSLNQENALTIFRDGQVVIGGGSSLSHANLNSDYLFAVDGRVICEELRVEDSGNWPDFVFEDSYELLHLTDVKKHIDENGHLPGVPSAKEINGKGYEIGAMNEILLRKVEELTLYIIDLQEQIEELQPSK